MEDMMEERADASRPTPFSPLSPLLDEIGEQHWGAKSQEEPLASPLASPCSPHGVMTAKGIGTTQYLAPELCANQTAGGTRNIDYDQSVDTYAFGVTMSELL